MLFYVFQGAVIGQSISLGILVWIGLGKQIAGIENATLPTFNTSGCSFPLDIYNVTQPNSSSIEVTTSNTHLYNSTESFPSGYTDSIISDE